MYSPNIPMVFPKIVKDGTAIYEQRSKEPLDDVAKMMETLTKGIQQECFAVCTVDINHDPMYIHFVGQDMDSVRMPDIFRVALLSGAAGVVVAHRYHEKAEDVHKDLRFYMKIVDTSICLGVSFFDYILIHGDDVIFRVWPDPSILDRI